MKKNNKHMSKQKLSVVRCFSPDDSELNLTAKEVAVNPFGSSNLHHLLSNLQFLRCHICLSRLTCLKALSLP